MTVLQHLLCKLAEEGNEVAQRALKTAYFGLNEVCEGKTNREMLHGELNDLMAVIEMLNEDFDLGFTPSPEQIATKKAKVGKYLAYSQDLNLTDFSATSRTSPPNIQVVTDEWRYEVKAEIEPALSRRGRDWQEFSTKVLNHIEQYTVPQYGDKGEDQASNYGSREHMLQVDRYRARFGKNSRPGQEILDVLKMAHYLQMSAMELENELREVSDASR